MISAQSRPFIDASVEVLREHGLTITRTFYSSMFKAHPELTNLFNMGNQASGAQQQSLASAVFAYAANIDNAAALGPVVKRIVHKHASVGITADHYPIVGRHLLGAIQTVLKDAASPPLLAAWDEAYTALANALISAEKELYTEAGVSPGELHPMRVTLIEQQSEQITSYTLEPAEGERLPPFKPGQYLSVSIPLENGGRQLRQYSLSDKPNGSSLRISVKRETAGTHTPAGQISNWIHNNVKLGDTLQVTHPFGEFTPDTASSQPLVLLSAGVGITPMISVLNTIAATNPQRQVIFGHGALLGLEQFPGRLPEQAQPAHEMLLRDAGQGHVLAVDVALELAGSHQDGGPEIHHARQVLLPAACQHLLEDGPDHLVLAHPVVKAVHQFGDGFVGEGGVFHGGSSLRQIRTGSPAFRGRTLRGAGARPARRL